MTNKRLRYSVRGLLLLTTLVCGMLGAAVWYRNSYIRQARALNELVEMKIANSCSWYDLSKTWRRWLLPAESASDGFTLQVNTGDSRLFDRLASISCRKLYFTADDFGDDELARLVAVAPNLEKLVLRKSQVIDQGLKPISQLKSLRKLSLGDICIHQRSQNGGAQKWYEFYADQFTDEALRIVADLPQLIELRVVSTSVGDQQLKTFSHSSQLESLALVSPRLTDECLLRLASLRNLNALLLGDGRFSASGLQHLTDLKQLKLLTLKSSHIAENGWPTIAQIRSLEMLSLEDTGASNEDLEVLASLPNLWNLYLAGSELDNRLLSRLRDFPKLAHLHLHETLVDDDGVDDLLTLAHINEIYVTHTQFSKSSLNRIGAKISIFDETVRGDPPVLFFGMSMNRLDMNADFVLPY
jgi:hypothetical protein